MNRYFFFLILFFFPLFVGIWAQTQYSPMFEKAPINQRDGHAMRSSKVIKAVDSTYILGPGDYLGISFEKHWLTVQVSLDAKVHIENFSTIDVNQKSLGQVTQEIIETLSSEYDREKISVSLVHKKEVFITVLGAVQTSGHFLIYEGYLASQAFLYAGKFNEAADIPGAILIRANGDTVSVDPSLKYYHNDIKKYNPELKMGDVFYVPFIDLTQPLVYIKDRTKYRPVTFREGWTIKRYLYGYNLQRWIDGLEAFQVEREGKTIHVPFEESDSFVLLAGDRINNIEVEQVVLVGGVVNTAGKIPYEKHMTPIEYVSRAGINFVSQEPDTFKVLRKEGKWEWLDPHTGVLYPGDFILIEKNRVEQAKDFSTITSVFLNVITSSLVIYLTAKGL